mgnify:CR=1 FL=1
MIQSITVINQLGDSVTLSLTDPWNTGLIITGIDGLGPTKANISTTDLAMGDGAVFNSSRIEKRNIVFHFRLTEVMDGDGLRVLKTIEQVRLDTYRYFQLKKKHRLIFETDNRYVEIEGYVESNEPDIFNKEETSNISIICPNPFFFAKSQQAVLNGINEKFEFPFSNESLTEPLLIMGESSAAVGEAIPYHADADSGVVMKIKAIGNARNIRVVNLLSKERFLIDTSKIRAIFDDNVDDVVSGDLLTFSSMPGAKTATLKRNGVEKSILPTISRTGQWLHLVNGDNVFSYTCESGGANITIEIVGYLLYEGV